jgi:ATP-binding cassette subfamily F protein uup
MGLFLTVQDLTKAFGAEALFRGISFTVSDGDRIGLIGPNGAGKSTLLGIIAGRIPPDDGEVIARKMARISYVAQESVFEPGATVSEVLARETQNLDEPERLARMAETLGRVGFEDTHAEASTLSGGWRKRLAIAAALIVKPDLLLLDEPTNHLDLEGILWLEKLLAGSRFATIVISHDRYFLENVASQVIELDRAYSAGLFRAEGSYSVFLDRKDEYMRAQSQRKDALDNRVRTEIEWLRRGPKARSTKAKARIDRANELIGELADLKSRARTSEAGIDFTASGRQTKRLIEADQVSYSIGDRTLFRDLSFTLGPGQRLGLVGPNGSGKTTLLRLLMGELQPASGEIRKANALRMVYFDQNRVQLEMDVPLRRALAADGDSVIYQEREIHVASWAARFLFKKEQLDQPVSRLSGGERARVLIANLMLQQADVLLLDEPTNDLDIPTLEILEESLIEFTGALLLVTHDRHLLDKVSTVVVGLDGQGGSERFAEYSQWEDWQAARRAQSKASNRPTREKSSPESNKKKLSYKDAREWETMEERIMESEQRLRQKQALLEDPAVNTDGQKLKQAYEEIEAAQEEVDALYTRWGELGAKLA